MKMHFKLKIIIDSFKRLILEYIHSCPKLKLQPVLSFSSFVHNCSINEHKNMKLRENIYYEMIY